MAACLLQSSQGVDESNITARFDNGVLEVVIEGAAAQAEPRRVQVEGQRSDRQGAGTQSGSS